MNEVNDFYQSSLDISNEQLAKEYHSKSSNQLSWSKIIKTSSNNYYSCYIDEVLSNVVWREYSKYLKNRPEPIPLIRLDESIFKKFRKEVDYYYLYLETDKQDKLYQFVVDTYNTLEKLSFKYLKQGKNLYFSYY